MHTCATLLADKWLHVPSGRVVYGSILFERFLERPDDSPLLSAQHNMQDEAKHDMQQVLQPTRQSLGTLLVQ